MHVFLWTLQLLLAFVYLAGGAYKTFSSADLAAQMPALSAAAWSGVGVIEMIGAALLVLPAGLRWSSSATPVAAAALMVETLALAALYARYSLLVSPANPLVWAVAMAVLVAIVAVGRTAVSPLV